LLQGHLDITLSFQAFGNLKYISSKVKLLSLEMCVAFAVFFEAINMAPFSFEGADGLFEFTHPKFEAFKQTRSGE